MTETAPGLPAPPPPVSAQDIASLLTHAVPGGTKITAIMDGTIIFFVAIAMGTHKGCKPRVMSMLADFYQRACRIALAAIKAAKQQAAA